MIKLITAIATTGLLALSGPALADRGDDHGYHRPAGSSHAAGPAHRDGKPVGRQHGFDRGNRHDSKPQHDRGNHQNGNHQNGNHQNGGHQNGGHQDRGHQDRGHYGGGHRDYSHHDNGHHGKPAHYRPHYYGQRYAHGHHWRPTHYHYGYRWSRLPRNFVRVNYGGLGFFYSDGVFYRPFETGYVVARAPVGALITSLPGTAVSVVFGGRNYYVAYDTYYLWDGPRSGYRIVANPGI